MLTNALRALVWKLFLEIFYWKNDKIINVVDNLLYFIISHKSGVKIFLLWFISNCPKEIRYHDPYKIMCKK